MSNRHFRSFFASAQMRFFLVAASGLLTAIGASADDKAIQRELNSLKGVWKAVQVRTHDETIPKAELDRQEVTLDVQGRRKGGFRRQGVRR